MDELERKVLNAIDKMREDIIKFHQDIVRIPSENPPSKYKDIAAFTEAKLKGLGLNTTVKRNNVVAEYGKNNGRSLILYGHYDTVEAFQGWTEKPFGGEIKEGKLYGRGASDDKSCVTAEIFAVKALLEEGVPLNGKLTVIAVGDEETGGLRGAEYLLSSGIVKGNACLLGDSPPDYAFGHTGGTMYVTFSIQGKQAHGLAAPDLPLPYRNEASGINTIERMVKIMNFLLGLKQEFLGKETKYPLPEGHVTKVSSVNIAEIHGGNKITTVPDKCYMHCSINTIPEQDVKSIKKRILDFVEELKTSDPDLKINIQIPVLLEPYVNEGNSDFGKAVKAATAAIFKEEREFKLFMPSTDAHWFQERHIDTILVGVSRPDNRFHAADEFVYLDDLINLTKIYALTVLNYLK